MFINLAMVSSVDGKITKGSMSDIADWTSEEDKEHFASLIKKNDLIIMGKNTYIAAKPIMKLTPKKLRIVITSKPEQYAKETIPNQLEFTSDSPNKLIKKLEKRGYKKALLVGGSHTNAAFLKKNLVDKLLLTVEPKLFAAGKPLIAEENLNINLQLKQGKKLNARGTLLLTYDIVKS